jgi:hypothetical protein
MGVIYYKRFRMEFDLERTLFAPPRLPVDYVWTPWRSPLLERHAAAKLACFENELDSRVFPCLGDLEGCRRLMQQIAERPQFVPGATWLLTQVDAAGDPVEDCGTIQGVMQQPGMGSIQNVGITPDHRGLGLGRALVLKALEGFFLAGASQVYLEVTARNLAAVQLYRSLGFRLARTSYRAVEHSAAEFSVV